MQNSSPTAVVFWVLSCCFAFFVLSFTLVVYAAEPSVVISEVAWAGTAASASDEWIELFNAGAQALDLDGWVLAAEDGSPSIKLAGRMAAGAFWLLERTGDDTVSNVSADMIYTGALGDDGEILELKDVEGVIRDKLAAWYAGSKEKNDVGTWERRTMERVSASAPGDSLSNWATYNGPGEGALDAKGNAILGTPRTARKHYAPTPKPAPPSPVEPTPAPPLPQPEPTAPSSVVPHSQTPVDLPQPETQPQPVSQPALQPQPAPLASATPTSAVFTAPPAASPLVAAPSTARRVARAAATKPQIDAPREVARRATTIAIRRGELNTLRASLIEGPTRDIMMALIALGLGALISLLAIWRMRAG